MDDEIAAREAAMLEDIRQRLEEFEPVRSNLIPVLQFIQERHRYLAPESLQLVAEHLQVSLAEVRGVATFYNQFRFNPPGRNPIRVCLGTACHVRGGDIILENFERKLEIREGETSADREFSLERVACVGCCALAPVALVGEDTLGHMAPSKVEGVLVRIEVEKQKARRHARREGDGA